jgi:hypothetical protein
MTAADWQPITTAFMGAVGLLLTALIARYVPQGIAAFEKRTGIQVSDQQTAAVYAAAQTAKGIIETELDQGALKLEHITPDNPAIADHAKAALAGVSGAAAKGTTVDAMARMIVGLVDTAGHPPPVPPVALLAPAAASLPAPPSL